MMATRPILSLPIQAEVSRDRMAYAPYNFVPLPETVVTAVDRPTDLPGHDRYAVRDVDHPDRSYHLSGDIEVDLTTHAPIYVRCGRVVTDDPDTARNRPAFFHTHDEDHPVIPGSSLRGMLRSVLEIASYGKVDRVAPTPYCFRSLSDRQLYTSHFVEERARLRTPDGKTMAPCYRSRVRAGFLRREGSNYVIDECPYGRIERQRSPDMKTPAAIDDIIPLRGGGAYEETLYVGRGPRDPNMRPRWDGVQYRPVRVALDPEDNCFFARQLNDTGRSERHPDMYLRFRAVSRIAAREEDEGTEDGPEGLTPATLVLTGNMQHKHLEYVFLHASVRRDDRDAVYNVPRDMIDLFNDEQQLTQWQEQAFPKDRPGSPPRERAGALRATDQRYAEPVFFLVGEDGEVVFLGRAQMFRLPYAYAPQDFVPAALRNSGDIDYAEALFGYVRGAGHGRQGQPERAYAGRISVSDAELNDTVPVDRGKMWLDDTSIVPRILGGPKPTAFQHYLVQDYPNRSGDLLHYNDDPADGAVGASQRSETVIRGHKRYWHATPEEVMDDRTFLNVIREPDQRKTPENSTQHTHFKPVRAGVHFRFRIHFDNLSARELGALCWALRPLGADGSVYDHSLGMGKALGLGAVALDATVHLVDRSTRYACLFGANETWATGGTETHLLSDRATLERIVEPFERHVIGELGLSGETSHLYDLERIATLLTLMEWPGLSHKQPQSLAERSNARPAIAASMRIEWRPTDGDVDWRHEIKKHNEYRARPVLPDPSQFDRPLTGELRPQPRAGSPVPPSTDPAAPRLDIDPPDTPSPDTAVTPAHPKAISSTAPVRRKRGEKVEVKVEVEARSNKDIMVSLTTPPYERVPLVGVIPVFRASYKLHSRIKAKIGDVDEASGRAKTVKPR